MVPEQERDVDVNIEFIGGDYCAYQCPLPRYCLEVLYHNKIRYVVRRQLNEANRHLLSR